MSTFYPTNDPTFMSIGTHPKATAEGSQFFVCMWTSTPRRSFLFLTMFPGWHPREYLCRVSERQISPTYCAQTMTSKFPKVWRLMLCLRFDVSCFVLFTLTGLRDWKANVFGEPALRIHQHLSYVSQIQQHRLASQWDWTMDFCFPPKTMTRKGHI